MPFKPLLLFFCVAFLLYLGGGTPSRARRGRFQAIRAYLLLAIVFLGILALVKMVL